MPPPTSRRRVKVTEIELAPLIERLRAFRPEATLIHEAADKLEALSGHISELEGALRWLRAWWEPGSDHDTEEVKHGLACADAALAQTQSEG
jgi:hypothetical protein